MKLLTRTMVKSRSLNAIYPVPVLKMKTLKRGIHLESLALIVYAISPRLYQISRKSLVISVNDNDYLRTVYICKRLFKTVENRSAKAKVMKIGGAPPEYCCH